MSSPVDCTLGSLLNATAVTRWLNGYQNKSKHCQLTLKKNILPMLLLGIELITLKSSNHESPLPLVPTELSHPQDQMKEAEKKEAKNKKTLTRHLIFTNVCMTAFLG